MLQSKSHHLIKNQKDFKLNEERQPIDANTDMTEMLGLSEKILKQPSYTVSTTNYKHT